MTGSIKKYCDELITGFDTIAPERKVLLEKIAAYISSKQKENKAVNLVYICTHNSRRSHFGQIWAQVAAAYFEISNTHTFSGGTEATAFHINAISALKRIGFVVKQMNETPNPVYEVCFGEQLAPAVCFSKVYNHPENPQQEFAAIMTCSDAEENCPFIPGVELRVGTTYDDPKVFDNTPQQDEKYDERCKQIALETVYAFSLVK